MISWVCLGPSRHDPNGPTWVHGAWGLPPESNGDTGKYSSEDKSAITQMVAEGRPHPTLGCHCLGALSVSLDKWTSQQNMEGVLPPPWERWV